MSTSARETWNPLTEWKHTDIDWIRVDISREDLGRFTRRSDFKGLLQSVGFLLLMTTTAVLCWWAFSQRLWLLLGLSLYLHGGFYTFFGPGLHELSHRTVFRSRWLADVMTIIYSLLYWPYNPYLYRASHQGYHHKYTLHEGSDGEDVPMYVELTPRFVFQMFLAVIHPKTMLQDIYRLLTLRPTSHGWRGRGFKLDSWEQFVIQSATEKDQRRIRAISIMNLVFQPLFVVACISLGAWYIPILTTFAPLYGPPFISFMAGIHQHAACEANEPDFRISCGDTRLGPFLSFLYWHMEYHIEHHMFAAIPCYNLRPFSKFVADQLPPKMRMIPRVLHLHRKCKKKYGSYDAWRNQHGLYKGY